MPRAEEFADLKGQRFGWLVALSRVPEVRPATWRVRCDCGVTKTVLAKNLRAGLTTTCGCKRRPRIAA